MHNPFVANMPRRLFLRLESRLVALLIAVLAVTVVAMPVAADEDTPGDEQSITIREWLLLGPLPTPLPAFGNEGKTKAKPADLLKESHIDRARLRPIAGGEVALIGGARTAWQTTTADTGGVHLPADTTMPRVAYLATYVEVPRWMKIDVEARASQPFELWLDGASVVKSDKAETTTQKGTAKLGRGKHLLLVKTVYAALDSLVNWTLGLDVSPAKEFDAVPLVSTDPSRTLTISDVLDGPSITRVHISPDGKLVAISMLVRRPPEGKSDRWIEVRRVADGERVRTLRDVSASNWQWAPTGHRLSYVKRDDSAGTLRVTDIDSGNIETIFEDVKNFSSYQWSPDGSFVAYSVDIEPEENKTGVQRLRGVSDRRAGDRDRSSLYVASVPAGLTRKLTAGKHSTHLFGVRPGGGSILIGRSYEDMSKRPYGVDEIVLVDVNKQTTELLCSGPWLGGATWSPDGKKILIIGGPSAFGETGINLPDGVIPNEYDGQVYLFDLETRTAESITREFDPAVQSVYWPKPGRHIAIVAQDGEYSGLFLYDVRKKSFKRIALDCDVIHRRDVAADTPVAVLTGSRANRPARLYAVNLKSGHTRELLDPSAERFEDVRIGDVEDWNFTTDDGTEIVGRIHFPANFDATKKWPCIVYYYGGTSPVSRSFGGRYPKNFWAAHGYVVYVPQPSGATGFGQAFSARHVNDWGKRTAGEIIEGTKQFLAAHDYVDPSRVGCIGASYGGFMTQLLVTKTDLFAAAVSHAGISMIGSYWGEGYWGYGYNAVSAANSFPWNRPDIYIDQSPLFEADKVTTPLLLLHGASDTNVPPGESEQMYTALKLLAKEVEYIRIEGQNHWIVDYEKRIVWSDAIISWFDRWLKGEPEWWNDMYPPKP